LEHFKVCYI